MKIQLDIIKYRNLWFGLSGVLMIAGLIAVIQSMMVYGAPVKLGLDFTGGTKLEYKFHNKDLESHTTPLNSEEVLNILGGVGLEGSSTQITKDADPTLIIRTRAISDDPVLDTLDSKLKDTYGSFDILAIDTVSPIIGPELLRSGLIALVITIFGIIIYISSRFKQDYAMCAIAALCHDVFIVVGLFAFLGLQYGIEVNSLFITAILTVFGFSVHDTIVVFDRVRENQKLQTRDFGFDQVANVSVNQVARRSIYTSITTLTALAMLFFFGGASTQLFVGAMFVGMFAGTYSSLFVASPLLVLLRQNERAKAHKEAAAHKSASNGKPKNNKKQKAKA